MQLFNKLKGRNLIALIVAAVILLSSFFSVPLIKKSVEKKTDSASSSSVPASSKPTVSISKEESLKLTEQLEILNEQIKKDGNNAKTYIQRAAVLSKLQKYDEALKDYTKAIELEPKAENYYLRSLCYVLTDNHKAAYDDLKLALNEKPDDTDYLSLMADVCSATKKYKEGLETLEKLIVKNPKNAVLYAMAGDSCVNISQTKKALEHYDNAIKNYSSATCKAGISKESLYAAKGNCHKTLEEYEKAVSAYDDSLKIGENVSLYFQRGYCLVQLGKYDAAITDFTKSIDKKYEVPISKFQRGLCYYSVGKYAEAIEDFKNYEKEFPKKSDSFLYHGLCLLGLKKYSDAMTFLQKSIDANISVGDCNFNLGNCYYNQEKYAEAIPYYTKAIEANVQVYPAYLNRGVAHIKVNKYNEAKADLKKVIDECPDKDLVAKASKSYEPIKNITIITK